MLVVPLVFIAAAAMLVWSWNRWFVPVPARLALALALICAAYQGGTLFTSKVDVPGNLAFVAYPWKAAGRPAAKANTGIVFTQIAPWTRVARDTLLRGEAPLWNRAAAAGAPLLANQQTAIFHPFTLLGLLLPLGKAFTLSASLRLFCVAFFTFVFLRELGAGTSGAFFGAVAFTFCTFHVVWLLFPLGLATMMLPACLAGAHELAVRPRPAAYVLLVVALSCSVLGGHPESALWVWIVTAMYAVFARWNRIAVTATAFAIAMLLTAFFWLPTLSVLRYTSRYGAMQSRAANPAGHGLSYEWLLPLVTPNILGTPVDGTYTPPRGSHPAVLNDYGEVASGYAGLSTLCLALAAPFVVRRGRALVFAIVLMVFAFLTIAEVPLWRDVLRSIPLAGISLHQRLRVVWVLGVCIGAALTVHAIEEGGHRRPAALALVAGSLGALAIYIVRHSSMTSAHIVVPVVTALSLAVLLFFGVRLPGIAAALVFVDLVVATYNYNPSARPRDVYPVTGALQALQRATPPYRVAAAGWSLLPDTPSWYGIEDIKTTDPVQNARYMRLLKGYLRIPPDSYDLLIRDFSQPFFDYLNVRFVYVPPDQTVQDARFVTRYRGPDGAVLENLRVLPRYFLVRECVVEPDFGQAVARLKTIADFRHIAVVDRVPPAALGDGDVRLRSYGPNATELEVRNSSWALLVTSDVSWPGWRADVDGKRFPCVVVNGAFVGCFIPPGGGHVTLRYRPVEFDLGVELAAAGIIALVSVLAIWKRRQSALSSAVAASAPPAISPNLR